LSFVFANILYLHALASMKSRHATSNLGGGLANDEMADKRKPQNPCFRTLPDCFPDACEYVAPKA
jgi:hypothetical protein